MKAVVVRVQYKAVPKIYPSQPFAAHAQATVFYNEGAFNTDAHLLTFASNEPNRFLFAPPSRVEDDQAAQLHQKKKS